LVALGLFVVFVAFAASLTQHVLPAMRGPPHPQQPTLCGLSLLTRLCISHR
jgi:hypothetical protein